jgi:hypothetical protein
MSNTQMVYTTLSIYSWSLFQFTLNMVASKKSDKARSNSTDQSKEVDLVNPSTFSSNKTQLQDEKKTYMHNELRIVIITLIMQDGPFFILRSLCVFKFNVVSYLFLFFTFKNGILFSLQIYRIIAICTDFSNDSKHVIDQTVANIGNGVIHGDLIIQTNELNSMKDKNLATISKEVI